MRLDQNNNVALHLYGTIGIDINGNDFAQEIARLSRENTHIDIHVNSAGGDVYQGMSIVSAIVTSKASINIYIDGIAASMAAVIAVSGNKTYMQDFAKLMIHDPYFTANNPINDKQNKTLNEVKDMLSKVLARRGKDEKEVLNLMSLETWFSAEEAKRNNLCDEVLFSSKPELLNLSPLQIAACLTSRNPAVSPQVNDSNVEKAVKLGYIEETQAALFNGIAATNREQFNAFIKGKESEDEQRMGTMIVQAIRAGKFIYQERAVYEQIGKEMGAKMLQTLLDSIPERISAMSILNGDHKNRTNWGLKEYRKFAPQELKDNPNLYAQLIDKQHLGVPEGADMLNYYRKNNPEYLRNNPQIYNKLTTKK